MTATASRYEPQATQPGLDATGSRHAALTRATADVQVRRGVVFSAEKVLLFSACILFPLGIVFILLGWEGAAHTGRTYAQIDYLISGGLLGVGLAMSGGFMYFGYWLSRQLNESRRQSALALQALERIERAVEGSATASSAAAGDPPPPAWAQGPPGWMPNPYAPSAAPHDWAAQDELVPAGPARRTKPAKAAARRSGASRNGAPPTDQPTGEIPGVMLVATQKGTLLHRPDCPVVARRSGVKPVAAGTPGYSYCSMCDAASAVNL